MWGFFFPNMNSSLILVLHGHWIQCWCIFNWIHMIITKQRKWMNLVSCILQSCYFPLPIMSFIGSQNSHSCFSVQRKCSLIGIQKTGSLHRHTVVKTDRFLNLLEQVTLFILLLVHSICSLQCPVQYQIHNRWDLHLTMWKKQ